MDIVDSCRLFQAPIHRAPKFLLPNEPKRNLVLHHVEISLASLSARNKFHLGTHTLGPAGRATPNSFHLQKEARHAVKKTHPILVSQETLVPVARANAQNEQGDPLL